jgi:hypothetical protein
MGHTPKWAAWEQVSRGIFRRRVKPQHFFIKYQGFGISENVLKKLYQWKAKKLIFEYRGNKERCDYHADIEQFLKSTMFHDNKGDTQKFVKLKEMVRIDRK